jgi:hypothetical protein
MAIKSVPARKSIDGRCSCRLPPFAMGKVRYSLLQESVAALLRVKIITLIIKVRAYQIFAGRLKNHIRSRASVEGDENVQEL